MNSIMHVYTVGFVLVYLDDNLVFSDTEDELEFHFHKVFDRLCKHKL